MYFIISWYPFSLVKSWYTSTLGIYTPKQKQSTKQNKVKNDSNVLVKLISERVSHPVGKLTKNLHMFPSENQEY